MKLMLIGHGRSGKDHAAEYLSKHYGLTFCGSSRKAAEVFLFDLLKDDYGYETVDECFADRHSPGMRKIWYESIVEFNTPDKTKLAKIIYEQSDVYVGIRSSDELIQLQLDIPDLVTVWIDASSRIEPESSDSCTVTKGQSDIILENNGSVKLFEEKLDLLADLLDLTRSNLGNVLF